MKWEVTKVADDSKELDDLLAVGWEPFAATVENWWYEEPYRGQTYEQGIIYLRRQVEEEEGR